MKLLTILCFCIAFSGLLSGQKIYVDSVFITGNKQTKERVIFRELNFSPQDSLLIEETLDEISSFNEKRLLSIGLFNEARMFFEEDEPGSYDVFITVNENWYIYPSPIFELADRNFNLWWYELNHDLSRVNYGLRAEHVNLTGNRDKLTLTTQLGYTRKLELRYNFPFLDKHGKWSTSVNAFYADVRELAYITLGNKTQFGRNDEEIMLTRFRIGGDIAYRKDLFDLHAFRLEYHNKNINPFAASELNPNYYLNGATQQQFIYLDYTFTRDQREFKIFPEAGYFLRTNLKKEGFGIFNDINIASFALEFEQYFNRDSKFIWGYRFKGKLNLLRNQLAFANNYALGWGEDLVRGYEIYAIDGSDYAYLKTGIHYKFYENIFDLSNVIPLDQFNRLDIKFYASFEVESGYVNEEYYFENNPFNNRLIYGLGPTLSVMLYNTYLFQLDYSVNHTGEGGIFLHNRISF